jgi:hypothetical protein
MKMQENELREDAIRSVLLKQLTMIDNPTPRVFQPNRMSVSKEPFIRPEGLDKPDVSFVRKERHVWFADPDNYFNEEAYDNGQCQTVYRTRSNNEVNSFRSVTSSANVAPGSAPTAPIVTATIMDEDIGNNSFLRNDGDSNGMIAPSNQDVAAPRIFTPPADALPQQQRNNRARRRNLAASLEKRQLGEHSSTVEVVDTDVLECDNNSGEDNDLQTPADQAASEATAIARSRFVYIQKLKIRGDSGRKRWDKNFMQAECTRLGINCTSKYLLKIAERLAAAATK